MISSFVLFIFWYGVVSNFGEPTFREVGASSFAHLVEKNELYLFAGVPGSAHIEVWAHHEDPSPGIVASPREIFWETSLHIYKGGSSRHVIVVVIVKDICVFKVTI